MMSPNIHVMTSHGRISVQCVRNGLEEKEICMHTKKDMLEKTCVHVLCVRKGSHLTAVCIVIWIFTRVDTSAQNVTDVLLPVMNWHDTDESTQERNHMNALFVANDLRRLDTLHVTVEFTVERNRRNATCVKKGLLCLQICEDMWLSTLQIKRTSVRCVTKVSAKMETCSYISAVYTAAEDHLTVLTVGSRLRQTKIWCVTFVFTLIQSRTHVDTVQNTLEHLNNSRHICWSHIMKVLGWCVTSVRSNSATVVTLSSIYFDMKLWSMK